MITRLITVIAQVGNMKYLGINAVGNRDIKENILVKIRYSARSELVFYPHINDFLGLHEGGYSLKTSRRGASISAIKDSYWLLTDEEVERMVLPRII